MIERRTARARAAALPGRGGIAGALLLCAAAPYGALIRVRNSLYDRGALPAHRSTVRSVCVGNLTTGGTGKTPLVARLAAAALRSGARPAILTRGYAPAGAKVETSDEVLLYGRLVPDVPVIVDGDRVRGAALAVDRGADLLLLDDGFQHRRFARDVDLVLLDARDPFGGGRLLPAGRLREPPAGLRRASAAVLTRCGRADERELREAAAAIARIAPDLPVLHEDHVAAGFVGDGEIDAAALQDAPVLVFSGIADGAALSETVEGLGARPLRVLDYGDHHAFGAEEIAALADEASDLGAAFVVTTEKDLVRLQGDAAWRGAVPLVAPRITARFSADDRGRLAQILGFEIPPEVGE